MTKDEELKEAREWLNENVNNIHNSEFVAGLLTAYHHHMLDKAWVSVKERLPEKNGFYIAMAGGQMYFCGYDNGWGYDGLSYLAVTHWQPLPELKDTKHDR